MLKIGPDLQVIQKRESRKKDLMSRIQDCLSRGLNREDRVNRGSKGRTREGKVKKVSLSDSSIAHRGGKIEAVEDREHLSRNEKGQAKPIEEELGSDTTAWGEDKEEWTEEWTEVPSS